VQGVSKTAFHLRQPFQSEELDIMVEHTDNEEFPLRVAIAVCRPKSLRKKIKFSLKQIVYALRGYRSEYNFYLNQSAISDVRNIIGRIK